MTLLRVVQPLGKGSYNVTKGAVTCVTIKRELSCVIYVNSKGPDQSANPGLVFLHCYIVHYQMILTTDTENPDAQSDQSLLSPHKCTLTLTWPFLTE